MLEEVEYYLWAIPIPNKNYVSKLDPTRDTSKLDQLTMENWQKIDQLLPPNSCVSVFGSYAGVPRQQYLRCPGPEVIEKGPRGFSTFPSGDLTDKVLKPRNPTPEEIQKCKKMALDWGIKNKEPSLITVKVLVLKGFSRN